MPPTDIEDATIAVVVSKLETVSSQITDLSTKMEDRPTWQEVRRIERSWDDKLASQAKQHEITARAQDHRITNLQAWQQWAGRLFMGGVVTAAIGAYAIINP